MSVHNTNGTNGSPKIEFDAMAANLKASKSKLEAKIINFTFPLLDKIKTKITAYSISNINDPRIGKVLDKMLETNDFKGIRLFTSKLYRMSPDKSNLQGQINKIGNSIVGARIHKGVINREGGKVRQTEKEIIEEQVQELKNALDTHNENLLIIKKYKQDNSL